MEIWKNIENYEGLYQISNLGNIRSKSRNGTKNNSYWNPIKKRKNKQDYERATLHKNNKPKTFFVHRLVLMSFIGEPPSSTHQVNHKNGIRNDNRLDNLEWVTPSENKLHSIYVLKAENPFKGKRHSDEAKQKIREYRTGRPSSGSNHRFIIINDVEYKGIRVACRELNLSRSTLMSNIKKKNFNFTSKGVFYSIKIDT